MPYPAYSTQFILYGPETPNEAFTVPDGFVAVVRDITLYTEAGDTYLVLRIQDSEAAPATAVMVVNSAGALVARSWEGRIVVPAPGVITLDVSNIGLSDSAYVGGYLLRLLTSD